MTEEWRPVAGFPDYAVSSHGRVKRTTPDKNNHDCRVLKPWLGNHGYETVGLAKDGRNVRRLVHRLVCEAFHGAAPSAAHHVAHGDGTRRNNHADNLRWATRSENMADSARHGTKATGLRHGRSTKPHRTSRGAAHGRAKLAEHEVVAIRNAVLLPGGGRRLAAIYGVSPATISLIRSGKIWASTGESK